MSLEVISVIDIDPSQPYISVVHCKQYDTVRMVEAHLYTDGVKWYVPSSNIYAMVQYRKSDHIGGFYDIVDDPTEAGGKRAAISVNANDRSIIYISIAQEVLTTFTPLDSDGTTMEAVFYDTITNARLGLFYFHLKVEESSIREVDLASNPYFNILAEQIKAVLEAETKLTGLTAEAETLAPDDDATAVVSGGTGADDPYHLILGIPSMPGMDVSAEKLAPNADPTATITGGTEPGEDYNIEFGIPAFPGLTVSDTTLDPGSDVSAQITGGTAEQPYNIEFGIPGFPGITVSDTTLAPGSDVSAQITGGTAEQPYNIEFGIPGFPGITASATQLTSDSDPTAVVTGGTTAEEKFNIAFGIPEGVGILSMTATYGASVDENTLPTVWVETVEELHVPDGWIQWTKIVTLCNDGNSYTNYSKALQGTPGPAGVAVQHNEPETTVKIWIDPDSSAEQIVIPEYTADEDAMIHSFSGVLMTTVKTIDRDVS